jgi:hypothetical protein
MNAANDFNDFTDGTRRLDAYQTAGFVYLVKFTYLEVTGSRLAAS